MLNFNCAPRSIRELMTPRDHYSLRRSTQAHDREHDPRAAGRPALTFSKGGIPSLHPGRIRRAMHALFRYARIVQFE